MQAAQNCNFVKDRVSIVTPVYNGEQYLGRLLDSVLAQSWDQIEMIVADDGSEDGTLKIAESYREKFQERGFLYHIVSAAHRNASAAVNNGLSLVTGEYLIWPDSDDMLERDSVRKRVSFLQENRQYQCVRSLGRYLNEAGERVPAEEKTGDLQDRHLFFPILEFSTFVCCGCYMLRSAPFFAIYPQRKIPEYDVGQNFQMLLPFTYFYPCPTIPEELYTVYVRVESHSHRLLTQQQDEKKYFDYENLLDEIKDVCNITDEKKLRRISLWKQRRRYELYSRYNRKRQAAGALFSVYRGGGIRFRELLRKLAGVFCGVRIRSCCRKLRRKFGRRGTAS